MIWWSVVLGLFGAWILSMAADYTFGGGVHGFLIAGIAAVLLRAWPGEAAALNPRRPPRSPASNAGRH